MTIESCALHWREEALLNAEPSLLGLGLCFFLESNELLVWTLGRCGGDEVEAAPAGVVILVGVLLAYME
jgi:hypothetical protein